MKIGFQTEQSALAFEVDAESRTITGLAVPYGVTAKKNGYTYSFSKGTIQIPADISRVKMLMQHDRSQAVGKAIELTDTDAGLRAKFKIARGPEGDRALTLAEDGVYDGLSVGLGQDAKFDKRGAVHHLTSSTLEEISLTPSPAFDDARISAVAAESDESEDAEMGDQENTEPVVETAPSTETAPTFEAPAVINPLGSPSLALSVTEESPYRFDRNGRLTAGQHDFSTDLISGLRDGDREGYLRALTFARENLTFDIDSGDGTVLNPVRQRPEWYVRKREFTNPLLAATRAGTLTDKTPMVFPKYASRSGLVGPHTEGVEPTPGAMSWTSQTITPGALSGKVEITRELWDQGGSPQVSAMVWEKMEVDYYRAAEAGVVAALVAQAASIADIAITTAAQDDALSEALAGAFADLQFTTDGGRFDFFAVQADLYKALATATDDAGRPLFPIINPQNANGSAERLYTRMNVHGMDAAPVNSLAASGTVSANSWLIDTSAVKTLVSAPERLNFEYRVAYVDLAIWGYQVSAVIDVTGVRQVTYDPTA
jgi:HK97 family phage prohead protease